MRVAEEVKPKEKADRRRNLRKPLIVQQVKFDSDRRTFFGYARNISRSGMFISTVNPQEPGRQFRVEFVLPFSQGNKVQCNCEVVWSRIYSPRSQYDPGMGLRFLDLPENQSQAIDEWVGATTE